MIQYCELSGLKPFDYTPLTYVLNLNEDTSEAYLNSFLKTFESNLPKDLKKEFSQKLILEVKRRLKPLMNTN